MSTKKDRSDCALWLIEEVLTEEQLESQFPEGVHGADIVGWVVSSLVSNDQPTEVYDIGERVFKHLCEKVLSEQQLDMDYNGTKVRAL